jgi:hypothetical protein
MSRGVPCVRSSLLPLHACGLSRCVNSAKRASDLAYLSSSSSGLQAFISPSSITCSKHDTQPDIVSGLHSVRRFSRAAIASADWPSSTPEMAHSRPAFHKSVVPFTPVYILMFTVFQVFAIPYQFIRERYIIPLEDRSPFVKKATPFQDFVIRCVRYAFANMPAFLGRVFFSKQVSLPFLRFRMLRHGVVTSPIRWTEVKRVSLSLFLIEKKKNWTSSNIP